MNLELSIPTLLARPELSRVVRVNEPNHFAAGIHFTGISRSFNTAMNAGLVSATDGMLLLQGTQFHVTGGLYYKTAKCGSAAIAPTIFTILAELGWDHLVTWQQIAKLNKFGIEIPPGSTQPCLRLC